MHQSIELTHECFQRLCIMQHLERLSIPNNQRQPEVTPLVCFIIFHLKSLHNWIQVQHQTFFRIFFKRFSINKFGKKNDHAISCNVLQLYDHMIKSGNTLINVVVVGITIEILVLKPSLKVKNHTIDQDETKSIHLKSFKYHSVHDWERRTNVFQDTHVIHVHDSKTKANSAALMCLIFAFMVCLKLQSLKGLSGGCKVWIWIRKQMLDSFSKTFKAARRCIQPFKPKGTSRTHTATGPRLRSEWWMC